MSKIDGFKFWRENLGGSKLILAPMVEQSELPWRMLSRAYGAQVFLYVFVVFYLNNNKIL